MELSGGEIIIQALKDEGVEYVFGYPGGAVLHIYDAIFRQNDVQHILVRHEQGAAHAADILALARATLDNVTRAIRTAPEVRSNRLMTRVPVDMEDVLLELEPMQVETSISELASRLGGLACNGQRRDFSIRTDQPDRVIPRVRHDHAHRRWRISGQLTL